MPNSKMQHGSTEGAARVVLAGGRETTKENKKCAQSITKEKVIASRSTATEAQQARLLELLKIGPQTTYSLRKHGLAQCAARIFGLRKAGYTIFTERVTATCSDGYTHVGVARYTLAWQPELAPTSPSEAPNE